MTTERAVDESVARAPGGSGANETGGLGISLEGLTRRYGDKTVVDQVSFDVRPGRMTGFVGGNGAGKTTTMRMIMGVLAPSAGRVTWDGEPITDGVRRGFGYMPEERGLYPQMGLLDQLVFLARLHDWDTASATDRARHLLDHFGLDDRRNDKLESLSLGNQQRVQIAAALVHQPTALILDEPFSGLDPLAVDSMVDLLHAEIGPSVPVLFSSHQLELVERLCDDLVILSHGTVVAAGSTDELRRRGPQRWSVSMDDPTRLTGLDGVWVVCDGHPDNVLVEAPDLTGEHLFAKLAGLGGVRALTPYVEPLSVVFREATR